MYRLYLIGLILPFSLYANDLETTLKQSRDHDPGYRQSLLTLEAKLINGKIALAKRLPNINADITASSKSTNNQAYSASGVLTISGVLPLYNPTIDSGYKIAKIDRQITQSQINDFKTSHTLSIIDSYFNTIKAQIHYNTQRTALNLYQKSYESAQALEAAGLKNKMDVMVSQSALDSAKVKLLEAAHQLSQSKLVLKRHVDQDIETLKHYQGEDIPRLTPPPLATLLSHALSQSEGITQARLNYQKAHTALNAAATGYLPQVNLSIAGTQNMNSLSEGLLDADHRSVQASLKASINIFSGGANQQQIKQALLNQEAARYAQQNTTYDIQSSIENSYQDFLRAQRQVSASHHAKKSADSALNLVTEQNQLGEIDEIELISAITKAQEAQEQYDQSIYQYFYKYLVVKRLAGLMNDNDIHEINQLLNADLMISELTDSLPASI